MRLFAVVCALAAGPAVLFAAPCTPGTLDTYIGLAAGCTHQGGTFSDFYISAGFGLATPIDPAAVSVTPGGTPSNPSLLFALNETAPAGSVRELFLHFSASFPVLTGLLIELGQASAQGDGVVTGITEVCSGGSFLGAWPVGCSGEYAQTLTFVTSVDKQLQDQAAVAASSFFDVFVEITPDGGLTGTGGVGTFLFQLDTTPGGGTTVPEPSTFLLLMPVLALASLRRRGSAPLCLVLLLVGAAPSFAGNKESPMAAADPKANVAGLYAFRSYDPASAAKVTLIMTVDPLQDPALGATASLFDPDIYYEIKVDNNNDAVADIIFQFRFTTETRLPNFFLGNAGVAGGAVAPANSPPPVPPGTLIIPPRITSFSDPGLGLRQRYTVTMIKAGVSTPLTGISNYYACPPNAGPRTMDYDALFNAAIQVLPNGVKVFAGTVDDPYFGDHGGLMDTFNLSSSFVLTPVQDAALQNGSSDSMSGFAVNAIAIEVPIALLTRTGAIEAASSTAATIGVWASTSRPRYLTRRAPLPSLSSGTPSQIHRVANPLINDLLIGMGFKDNFGMEQPRNDAQYASFFLDPAIARALQAATAGAIPLPAPPRLDLLPLITYAPPVAAAGTPAGPIADLLRLNTGVPPTPAASANRLGLLGGDAAGFPNGRRLMDDVLDIQLRLFTGVLNPAFNIFPNNRLGDVVNVNDAPFRASFPFLASAPSGRNRRHVDPAEPACTPVFGGGASCAP